MNREQYVDQVQLLLDCLPALKEQEMFALKGGTAINFFVNDLPRLSVDIDLTYTKLLPRNEALDEIQSGLRAMGDTIVRRNKRFNIKELKTKDNKLHKIVVKNGVTKIKIEPNFIMRGTLLPITKMNLTKSVENKFEYSVTDVPVLSHEELFAGKICAALSRQHPRDFFDVHVLLEGKGITEGIRQAFVVYLLCSPRPIHELLQPNIIDLQHVYENEFINMTEVPVTLDLLLGARDTLIKTINKTLTANERAFLLSVKKGHPDYSLMPFKNLHSMPALKWKLLNIAKMDSAKHLDMLNKLTHVLEVA